MIFDDDIKNIIQGYFEELGSIHEEALESVADDITSDIQDLIGNEIDEIEDEYGGEVKRIEEDLNNTSGYVVELEDELHELKDRSSHFIIQNGWDEQKAEILAKMFNQMSIFELQKLEKQLKLD